ncbi:MAG TPA: leucyl/phenylalanyl-tRNA--protein transferase [Kofleriaceae bacterium]|nr:leucyl/phenylalanyl-tRNA--protein transferase [Kofleriaceae bacterium]
MPVFRLDDRLQFPPVHLAEDGLLALGGDLRPERLLLGYSQGIFPWYAENLPILWHSPDPRMVMTTRDLIVQRSLRKAIRKRPYELRMDTAFSAVLEGCASVPRPGQNGTWLIPEMVEAYERLHELGFAHSIEAWAEGALVGGLYGVSLGGAFFGESMFARAPDASKIAFVAAVRQLDAWGIGLIDCQVHTEHLERFGAFEVPRLVYLEMLRPALDHPTRRGKWTLELDQGAFAAFGGDPAGGGVTSPA